MRRSLIRILSHRKGLEHNHSGVTHHKHNHHKDYAMVYSDEIEDKIDQIKDVLKANYPEITNHRWVALKLLEQDRRSRQNIR